MILNNIQALEALRISPSNLIVEELQILTDLKDLFVFQIWEQQMGMLRDDELLSSDDANWIHEEILRLCQKIRPHAVSLMDSYVLVVL